MNSFKDRLVKNAEMACRMSFISILVCCYFVMGIFSPLTAVFKLLIAPRSLADNLFENDFKNAFYWPLKIHKKLWYSLGTSTLVSKECRFWFMQKGPKPICEYETSLQLEYFKLYPDMCKCSISKIAEVFCQLSVEAKASLLPLLLNDDEFIKQLHRVENKQNIFNLVLMNIENGKLSTEDIEYYFFRYPSIEWNKVFKTTSKQEELLWETQIPICMFIALQNNLNISRLTELLNRGEWNLIKNVLFNTSSYRINIGNDIWWYLIEQSRLNPDLRAIIVDYVKKNGLDVNLRDKLYQTEDTNTNISQDNSTISYEMLSQEINEAMTFYNEQCVLLSLDYVTENWYDYCLSVTSISEETQKTMDYRACLLFYKAGKKLSEEAMKYLLLHSKADLFELILEKDSDQAFKINNLENLLKGDPLKYTKYIALKAKC